MSPHVLLRKEQMKLFLCHSSKNAAIVTEIRDSLEAHGVPCWMAPRDIPPGSAYEECVIDAIKVASHVVVFLSSASIVSPEVEKEVKQAVMNKKPIFPVAIDGTALKDLPAILLYHLSGPQWIFVKAGAESVVTDILAALHQSHNGHKEMVVKNSIAANKAEWYESRRNELLSLLGEATELELPERYANELRQTARKCQEDAFEIALVGEFQGGKSTTFNALCDGRDISPRGLGGGGIKTSAAVVTAQNIAGDETKDGLHEWAEVSFKTAPSIVLGMSTFLRRPLADMDDFRRINAGLSDETFAETVVDPDRFPSLINLDDPEHRNILKAAVDSIWKRWNDNKASLSSEELDDLRISTLQLRFYDTPGYRSMVAKTVLGIGEFQKLIAFPKDWDIRWTVGANAAFTIDEVAFVFVQSVLLRIHSENLRRLGCRVTDCPGLFANAYDTKVAERTIANADAVWYLINGDRSIVDADKKIIKKIASMGMLGKIEATCNLKSNHEQKIAEILPATKAALASEGHDVDVLPYNARLAFLSMQGSLLLDPARKRAFTVMDESNMRKDAHDERGTAGPCEMWTDMIVESGYATGIKALKSVRELNSESVALVRHESLLDGILLRLETEIIPKKAQSILVDKGSDRAAKALVTYEGILKATENAAEAKEAEWKAKAEEARRQLCEFVDRAKTVIDRSAFADTKDDLAMFMAKDIVDIALDDEFIDVLTTNVSAVLRITARKIYSTRKAMQRALVQKLTPIMAEDFRDSLTRAIDVWKANADTNSIHRLHRSLENVCADIHDLWEDRNLDQNEFLDGFTPPKVDAYDILGVCGDLSDTIMGKTDIGSIAEASRRGIFALIWEVTWPILLGAIGSMICLPLTIGVFVVKVIWDLTRSEEELERAELEKIQREIGKIFDKVRPEIQKAVSGCEFRERIAAPLKAELVGSIVRIETLLRNRLDDLKTDFEKERVAKPQSMFGKSAEERRRIANANRAERTNVIEPLRKRIETFAQTVSAEMAG